MKKKIYLVGNVSLFPKKVYKVIFVHTFFIYINANKDYINIYIYIYKQTDITTTRPTRPRDRVGVHSKFSLLHNPLTKKYKVALVRGSC